MSLPALPLSVVAEITDELDHPECAIWDPQRACLFAGGEAGQLYRIDLEGEVTHVATAEGEILGLALDGQGRIYACAAELGALLRIEPDSGHVETVTKGPDGSPFILPNFAAFDAKGNLYVTDSGNSFEYDGKVVVVAPDKTARVWTRVLSAYPNGCCINASGTYLYVAESHRPGVSRVPIENDGSAGPPELLAELPGTVPDGIALDRDGCLYVACYRPDRILRIDPDGQLNTMLDDPHGGVLCAPTNISFAGSSLNRMVIANVGEWHLGLVDVGAVGLALEYPAP